MMAETSTAAAATRGKCVENVRVEAKSDTSITQPEQRLCIRPPVTRQFLADLVPGASLHSFAFQTFSDRKGGDRRLARTIFGTFDEVARTLVDLNRSGAGVFVALNEFRADAPAWSEFLGDLDARGLDRPVFVIVDGALFGTIESFIFINKRQGGIYLAMKNLGLRKAQLEMKKKENK